ncbi:Protein shifted isoform X4 [Oopsacas minuta]|uniref:Protein shifted isoform X4 n=1 Tax=Oopsacas minuta TaxID=111878 RepID=A0AAV7K8L5_9METZ|nr:Protein shifted isoform X4 [Oopsacas minuta]
MNILFYYLVILLLTYNIHVIVETRSLTGNYTRERLVTDETGSRCVNEYRYESDNNVSWLRICADEMSEHTVSLLCRNLLDLSTNSIEINDSESPKNRNEKVRIDCDGDETRLEECNVEIVNSCKTILHDKVCVNCSQNSQCNGSAVCGSGGVCVCEFPNFGADCELRNCSPPCNINQTCNNQTGICQCKVPFYGNNCELRGSVCPAQCLNGGSCNFADGTCLCANSYHGDVCELRVCIPACKNGGVCISPNHCKCVNGTYGVLCEEVDSDIFRHGLTVGVSLAVIVFFILVIICMIILLCIQLKKLMKYKLDGISIRKKKIQKELKREVQMEDYVNIPKEIHRQQAHLTQIQAVIPNLNRNRLSEVYYAIPQQLRNTEYREEGYSTMRLHYDNVIAAESCQDIESGQQEQRTETPEYIELQ